MQTSRGEAPRLVWIRRQRWHVERVAAETGITRFDVRQGGDSRTFLEPFDRPAAVAHRERPVHVSRARAIAKLASNVAGTFSLDSLTTATRAAIDLYPYQLEPALAVLAGQRRLLIADAVGLGKTVQAGLVIAELLSRAPTTRALIIAPAGLLDQWQSELLTRFGITTRRASPLDTPHAFDDLTFGENPWLLPGVWVGSADYLKQPHVLETLPLLPWDVIVVDEAHGAAGASDRHAAVHALCQRARHVLLLSATPHSGDQADFDRLLTLGDVDAAGDVLLVFDRARDTTGRSRRVRKHLVQPRPSVERLLSGLEAFEQTIVAASRIANCEAAGALFVSVLWRRALSTISALSATLARRLHWLESRTGPEDDGWSQARFEFDDEDDLIAADERQVISSDVGLSADRERRELTRLTRLAAAAAADDPKLVRLRRIAVRTTEPVVVFTEFRRSLEAAAGALQSRRVVAVLHGGLSQRERRHELSRFLGGQASVLVATDVAGQGLNLQSRARWVVNIDLPWNPARLEQRIGRVDRLGQNRPVHLTLLTLAHAADRRLLQKLTRRVDIARQSLGPAEFSTLTTALASPIASTPAEITGAPTTSSTAWTRRARAMARVLTLKRTLLQRWRSPSSSEGRPVLATTRGARNRAACGWLLGFRAELVDGTGASVEARVIVIRVVRRRGQTDLPQAIAAGRAALLLHLRPRMRRVQRMTAVRAKRRESTEAALAGHLMALQKGREVQLGLFNRLGVHGSTLGHSLGDTAWTSATELEHIRQTTEIHSSAPALVWVWTF